MKEWPAEVEKLLYQIGKLGFQSFSNLSAGFL
jgi:hypothetical protein